MRHQSLENIKESRILLYQMNGPELLDEGKVWVCRFSCPQQALTVEVYQMGLL